MSDEFIHSDGSVFLSCQKFCFEFQSHNSERNWSERNGTTDYNDWNGYNNNNAENGLSTSPRKDFGSTMRITSREDTNWRRRPGKEEDDSWRSSRHGRGLYSYFNY